MLFTTTLIAFAQHSHPNKIYYFGMLCFNILSPHVSFHIQLFGLSLVCTQPKANLFLSLFPIFAHFTNQLLFLFHLGEYWWTHFYVWLAEHEHLNSWSLPLISQSLLFVINLFCATHQFQYLWLPQPFTFVQIVH